MTDAPGSAQPPNEQTQPAGGVASIPWDCKPAGDSQPWSYPSDQASFAQGFAWSQFGMPSATSRTCLGAPESAAICASPGTTAWRVAGKGSPPEGCGCWAWRSRSRKPAGKIKPLSTERHGVVRPHVTYRVVRLLRAARSCPPDVSRAGEPPAASRSSPTSSVALAARGLNVATTPGHQVG